MKAGEECQLCLDTLTVGCEQYDSKICDIKERYVTDPNMGAEDVINQLVEILSPEQIRTIGDTLVERGSAER